tara:strand:+ start:1899 stop:2948 length:1050 start_codon:yes stop_codon:yes gene_type:complete
MDGTKLNRHVEEVAKWRRGEWFAPLHMELSLTNVCNQKCTFCYTIWAHGRTQMSTDQVTQLIRSAKSVGVKSTLIAGEGEPTVNPAYVPAIETCGEVGLDAALNTNAVKMNEEEIVRILPHLSWVRFSVQGSTPERYAAIHQVPSHQFHKAMGNIATACRVKKDLGLKVTLGLQQVLIKENGDDIYETARLARELGCDYYVIKPCHPHDLNDKYQTVSNLVETYRDNLKRLETLNTDNFKAIVRWNFLGEAEIPRSYERCIALPFIVQITADGNVVTCYPHSDKSEHSYGSLHKEDFADIVKSDKFRSLASQVEHNVDVHKCMPTCRHHNANKYLWWLQEEQPDHLNFI